MENSEDYNFVKVTNSDSNVWKYFLCDKDKEVSKCLKCGNHIKSKGKTTTGMIEHLKRHHQIDVREQKQGKILSNF